MPVASLTPGKLRFLFDEAALIVPALGYRPNTVPVFDANGARVPLAADLGRVAVDRMSRLACTDGTAVPGLFGVGLGTGYVPWGELAGEPSFDGHQNSLWLYQSGLGRMIFEGVRTRLAESDARGATVAVSALATASAAE